jgi:hypothetical protein
MAPSRGCVAELSGLGSPGFAQVPLITCCPGVPASARDVIDSGPAGQRSARTAVSSSWTRARIGARVSSALRHRAMRGLGNPEPGP